MDQRIGGINLVSWQGRRTRRLKSGVSIGTVVIATCALSGCSTLTAQVLGILSWSGPLAAVPAGLVLAAACLQIIAMARAAVAWFVG